MSACCASLQLAGCLTGWLAEMLCWVRGPDCLSLKLRVVAATWRAHMTSSSAHASSTSSCNEHSCVSSECRLLRTTPGGSKLAVKSSCCLSKPVPQLRQHQPGRTLSWLAAAGYTGRQPRPDQVRGTAAQQDPSHLVNINALDTPRPATTGIPGYGGHQLPAELAVRGEAGLAACQVACTTAECTQPQCLHRGPSL